MQSRSFGPVFTPNADMGVKTCDLVVRQLLYDHALLAHIPDTLLHNA